MYLITGRFHSFIRQLSIVVISASAAPGLTYGATFYVGKSGSDNYSCSQAQAVSTPKTTIAAGLACLSGGDTLTIKAGTYAERITSAQLPAGTANAKTVIQAAAGETVILRPTGTINDIVRFSTGKNHITLSGLIFDGAGATITSSLITIRDGASFIRVENSILRNASNGDCVGTVQGGSTPSSDLQFVNNKVHDCGFDNQNHGLYVSGNNLLVDGNETYNNSGHGIHVYEGSFNTDNAIVRYNYTHDNGSRGILIGSGNNNIAHHNIAANNGAAGIAVGFFAPDNNQVYNNTIYANSGDCIEVRLGATNSKVKNNLCLSNGKNTILNNGIGSVLAKNHVSTDPTLVVDARTNQFNPRDGSALIDAGENIAGFSAGKFVGLAPDQGAVEAPQGATTPKAPTFLQVAP
jgi:hypothetical protein